MKPSIDVIIPVYKPDGGLRQLLKGLMEQTLLPEHILLVNTEESYFDPSVLEGIRNVQVIHIKKREFDHGGTRHMAAEMLQEKFPDRRIISVDSKQASMGEGLFAYLVGCKRLGGADLDAAAAYARELAPKVCAWFTVDDLMFLKRGGRVSSAAAVAGTLLGIKPVLHVDEEGHLIPKEKVRGRRASLDALVKHFEATALDKTGGTVFISHGDCADDARYVIDKLRALGVREIEMGDIGPVIGAHSGPGTVALFWLGSAR